MHGLLNVKRFTATADDDDDDDDDDSSFIHSFTGRPVTVKPISPVQQQSVVTHTIRRRTEIPASARSWVTNTPSVKMWRAQKISLQTCLSVGLLGIGQNVLCLLYNCVSVEHNKLPVHERQVKVKVKVKVKLRVKVKSKSAHLRNTDRSETLRDTVML